MAIGLETAVTTLGPTDLEGAVDESWRVTLRTLLVDPLGVNLRNIFAHGLSGLGSEIDSTLCLFTQVFLAHSLSLRITDHAVE